MEVLSRIKFSYRTLFNIYCFRPIYSKLITHFSLVSMPERSVISVARHSHNKTQGFSPVCNAGWGFWLQMRTLSLPTKLYSCNLSHIMPPWCGQNQRRHLSTEPTTAYEVLLASRPIQLSQTLLEGFHDVSGLPWWASIVLSTIAFRAVLTFPLGVYTQYIIAKVERLQPEIVMLAKQAFVRRFAERARLEGWSEKRADRTVMMLMRHYSKELFIRDNCHPAKGSILLLVQLPLWICLSLSLRNMTGAFAGTVYLDPANIVPSLAAEGALWFPDLTAADPFMVLPVLVGLLNLCNVEMMALREDRRSSRTRRYITNLLRGVSLLMVPIAAYMPSAMSLYWATSAFYGLCQNLLLKSPTVRSNMYMPPVASDSNTPYRDMWDIFRRRFSGRNKIEELQNSEKKVADNKMEALRLRENERKRFGGENN